MIATVAGCALLKYRTDENRPPLGGAGLLFMGFCYMYIGSALYVWQVLKLRNSLRLGTKTMGWAIFNAGWPIAIWSVSLACMLDEPPHALLNALRCVENWLPSVLRASLFLDPPALHPVCKILRAVISHETKRSEAIQRHAVRSGTQRTRRTERSAQPSGPLSDEEIAQIIAKRLERMHVLQCKLESLGGSDRAVPTALAAPLLDALNTEAEQLEKVLEVDIAQQKSAQPMLWLWPSALRSEHQRLIDEVEALRVLRRRIAAVKYTSFAFTSGGETVVV